MRKYIFLFLVFFSLLSQAQDYSFISKDYSKIDKYQCIEILQKFPKTTFSYYLENGKEATKAFSDSINNPKFPDRYDRLYYADTINQKAISVLKKLSQEEIKIRNQKSSESVKTSQQNRKELLGSSVEKLNLTDIEGKHYSLNDLKGKIIVLNFWFTKCAPCIQEMPDLNKLKEKYKSDNVVFFAITYDKSDIVKRFTEKIKLDYTIIPNDRPTIDQFKIGFFPTNMLINKEGKIEYINELFKGNGIEEISKKIKKLI